MAACKNFLLIIVTCFYCSSITAQVHIPAFTGYALPVETSNKKEESGLFSEKAGVHNWVDTRQQLQYFFYTSGKGSLNISLLLKNNIAGSKLRIAVAGQSFVVPVPAGKSFKSVTAGVVNIVQPGFYSIKISALSKGGKVIADIEEIELDGGATAGMQVNTKPRRNAASVHLLYSVPDTIKAVSFYSEVTIPPGADPLHTYYMANGFARGYFGIQVNSATERRVIFSVWDAGKEAVDRSKVADDQKVVLLGKGDSVIAEGFGNEGTGGHSHLVYNWKSGQTYKFLVTALPDSAAQTTIYAGYFYMPEIKQWKFIAAFQAPEDGMYLHHLYSFVENFDGVNGQLKRKSFFGNQWIRDENGKWIEITKASFSYDATGKAGDRIDYGGGTTGNKFYLWNGGFEPADVKFGDTFSRRAVVQSPVIDLYNNADSVAQAQKDRQIILNAVAAKTEDTTGSKNGLYYRIMKEGTGDYVQVSDTVVAFYKGALLNGEIFDQTKEKPATFPLSRLIKGWQTGLPYCRVGGRIRLLIPSGLAYSVRARSSKIPPNSILIFDIDVVEARKAVNHLP